VIPDPTFSDALSADNVALITSWLQECNENHIRSAHLLLGKALGQLAVIQDDEI
jgi:hypothetical protein